MTVIAKKKLYFTRFSNKLIQCNIENDFAINKKFYVVYILIDKYRTQEDFSWITISEVFYYLGFKQSKRKKKQFYDIISCLQFLISRKMIDIHISLDEINYDTGIKIKIIAENFDATENFTMIDSTTFEITMHSKKNISKENLLLVYLYIASYIYIRKKNDGIEHFNDPQNKPEAFFKDLGQVSKEIGMSPTTLISCINELVNLEILKKKIVGSIKNNNDNLPPKNVPNIYVLNKDGWEQEITWAENKLKEMYQVDKFNKFIQKK